MARITFEGKRYLINDGETVLSALVRGGANVPFSCKKGTCQTCMMRAIEGDPGASSQSGLRETLREQGHFLPCQSRPTRDLVVARPDPAKLVMRAHVHAKEAIAPNVVRVLLEPETNMTWRPGQFLNLRAPDGETRSYSLASVQEEDYYLELHIKRTPGGKVSPWIADTLATGDIVDIQGPLGECVYDPAAPERPLLLAGVGTGLSPLIGIVREALLRGHRGDVFLYHGAREPEGLYERARLEALAASHPNFRYVPCVSGPRAEGAEAGRVLDVAFRQHTDLSGWIAYFCGLPEMVYDGRYRAFRAGVAREDIHSDPFEHARPMMPNDAAKLATLAPDPSLWEALGHGAGLRAILTDFYNRVYEDSRLAPFFHNVTKERAIDKQYAFLADVFAGTHDYFGLKPFNAHHWMIISDELFDYRERLMEECMRRYGLPEHLVRRWSAVHELFRRELVKSSARGMIIDGREHLLEGFREEMLDVACVCDGCGGEMPPGSRGRMHARTGALYCAGCGARKIGQTTAPPMPG